MNRQIKKTCKGKDVAVAVAVFVGLPLLFYATGLGCPIRFVTGVSCPGCGMTRAWLYALTLRFDLALAYHPLFWLVPLLAVLVVARKHMNRHLFNALVFLSLGLIIAVWIARLFIYPDSNMLFSCPECVDVVHVEEPPWLQLVRNMFANGR